MQEVKLDIGCGANKQKGFVGVDPQPYFHQDLVCTLAEVHNTHPYGTVDEIYSRRCLQHIPDDVAALEEMVKLLKEGGFATIIVSGWRAWLFYQLWWRHTHRNIYPCCHLYTKGRLERKLRKLKLADYLTVDFCIYRTRDGCRSHNYDVALKLFKRREMTNPEPIV